MTTTTESSTFTTAVPRTTVTHTSILSGAAAHQHVGMGMGDVVIGAVIGVAGMMAL